MLGCSKNDVFFFRIVVFEQLSFIFYYIFKISTLFLEGSALNFSSLLMHRKRQLKKNIFWSIPTNSFSFFQDFRVWKFQLYNNLQNLKPQLHRDREKLKLFSFFNPIYLLPHKKCVEILYQEAFWWFFCTNKFWL